MLVQSVTMFSSVPARADTAPRPGPAAPASAAGERQEPPAATAAGAATVPTREAVQAAVEASRRAFETGLGSIQFRIDESTGRMVVQVLDPATDEVLRQIPSEEILAIARSLDRTQGLLISQQA